MRDDHLLDIAVGAAESAGRLLLERFGEGARNVGSKSTPTDLVSDADRDAEAQLLEMISRARPGDGVLAEEGGRGASTTGIRWVIDPLDGTVNYLFGIPVWCVSLCAEDEQGALIGVIHDPNRNETFTATRGGGAALDGKAVTVTDCSDLSQALIGTGFSYDAGDRELQAQRLPRVLPRVRDIRRAGSAALDLASVACGRLDGFYESPMERWDQAAGVLLVMEAGGLTSELAAPHGGSPGIVAAGNGIHDDLRALILG